MASDPTSATATTVASASAASTYTVQLTTEEMTRARAALDSKVKHHGNLAVKSALIQSERDRHAALKSEYAALASKMMALSPVAAPALAAAVSAPTPAST